MLILGIESTCDETAASLVRDGKEILSNVIFSQTDLHERYGGVFPELACRRHVDTILPVLKEALQGHTRIDGIAVSKGPGLIGAILIGLNVAKALSFSWNIPFVGVNHVEAHLYAAIMAQEAPVFPAIGLVISGGHTFLVKIQALGSYELLGTTRDDAIGEAFDKVAALLGLPYPGGPHVERYALQGKPGIFSFKGGGVKGYPLDFSFSGLKTSVLYALKGQNGQKNTPVTLTEQTKADLCFAFQQAALLDVIQKTLLACQQEKIPTVYVGGGVSLNQELRRLFSQKAPELNVFYPTKHLSLDNAAMIAGLGFHLLEKNPKGDPLSLSPMTRIPL